LRMLGISKKNPTRPINDAPNVSKSPSNISVMPRDTGGTSKEAGEGREAKKFPAICTMEVGGNVRQIANTAKKGASSLMRKKADVASRKQKVPSHKKTRFKRTHACKRAYEKGKKKGKGSVCEQREKGSPRILTRS